VENICDIVGLDLGLVAPVTSSELGQKALRPLRAGLATELAGTLMDDPVAPFRENLRLLTGVLGADAGPSR
jgi:hypothetical protein